MIILSSLESCLLLLSLFPFWKTASMLLFPYHSGKQYQCNYFLSVLENNIYTIVFISLLENNFNHRLTVHSGKQYEYNFLSIVEKCWCYCMLFISLFSFLLWKTPLIIVLLSILENNIHITFLSVLEKCWCYCMLLPLPCLLLPLPPCPFWKTITTTGGHCPLIEPHYQLSPSCYYVTYTSVTCLSNLTWKISNKCYTKIFKNQPCTYRCPSVSDTGASVGVVLIITLISVTMPYPVTQTAVSKIYQLYYPYLMLQLLGALQPSCRNIGQHFITHLWSLHVRKWLHFNIPC